MDLAKVIGLQVLAIAGCQVQQDMLYQAHYKIVRQACTTYGPRELAQL